ncbi:MAG: DMT family transporter, partial [Aestuariivirga sp.]
SQHARLWFMLPGLLGTFFAFASLYGYKHMGAATTITLIISSQLITGVVMDALTLHASGQQFLNFQKLLGVGLLAVGSLLILRSS